MKTLKTLFLSLFLAFSFSNIGQTNHSFTFNCTHGTTASVVVMPGDTITLINGCGDGGYIIDGLFEDYSFMYMGDVYQIVIQSNQTLVVKPTTFPVPILTLTVTVNTTSVSENQDIKFNVYPNPFVDFINIEGKVQNVSIFDLAGKLILSDNTSSDNPTVDVSHLDSGTYLLVINDKKTIKIVK